MNDVALRANDVMLRINDVGLRPMMLRYVQMESFIFVLQSKAPAVESDLPQEAF